MNKKLNLQRIFIPSPAWHLQVKHPASSITNPWRHRRGQSSKEGQWGGRDTTDESFKIKKILLINTRKPWDEFKKDFSGELTITYGTASPRNVARIYTRDSTHISCAFLFSIFANALRTRVIFPSIAIFVKFSGRRHATCWKNILKNWHNCFFNFN